jgi:predicted DCC family thiol-disulfide oxidoreductase YuxK
MPTVLYFDGECHLCHGAVQFVLKHEKGPELCFAHVNGERAKKHFPDSLKKIDSLVLEEDGQFYSQSDAALRLTKYLRWYWQALQLLWVFPPFLRNAVYRWIARHRYSWFGKLEQCRMPRLEDKERFLFSEGE